MVPDEINRIDPESVAAFFREHSEISPVRHRFVASKNDGTLTACCGLSAAVFGKSGILIDNLSSPGSGEDSIIATIAIRLGIDGDYAEGFMNAWDNSLPDDDDMFNMFYREGYHDGKVAADLVLPH